MGIWVNYAQAVLTLLTVAMTIVVATWARSAAKNGKEARRLVETLAAMMRKGHRYSDPSGAAVVTDGPAVDHGDSPPVPAVAEPIAVPTLASPRAALLPAPSEGPSSSARDKAEIRARAEAQEDARESARADAPPGEVAEDACRTVQIPRPVFAPPVPGTEPAVCGAGFKGGRPELPRADDDSGDRDTDDELTRVYSAEPGAADAQIPGVEVRQRSERPTLFGGGMLGAPPLQPSRVRAKYATLPPLDATLVSASPVPREDRERLAADLDAPPDSEARAIAVERIARLTEEEIARIDALAELHGVTREAMLVQIMASGEAATDGRAPGPTTPPDAPANDGPPSGKRRT
jgi:hypothetical protein